MSNVVQAVADTGGALGPDVPVDHIDDQLVEAGQFPGYK